MTDRFYELVLPMNILISLFLVEVIVKLVSTFQRSLFIEIALILFFTAIFVMVEKTLGIEVDRGSLD